MILKILLGLLCLFLVLLAVTNILGYFKGEEDGILLVAFRLLLYTVIFLPSFNYVIGSNTDEEAIEEKKTQEVSTQKTNDSSSTIDNDETDEYITSEQPTGFKKYNPRTGEWTSVQIQNSSEKSTSDGGLGESLQTLKKQYGEYEKESERIFYKNRSIYTDAPYKDKLVWNITINFENTDNAARTEKEVLELAKSLMPQDAKKIDQSEVVINSDYTTTIINYKSDWLAKQIDEQSLYGDAELGTFAIHLNIYTGDEFEKGCFQFRLITGNPQP